MLEANGCQDREGKAVSADKNIYIFLQKNYSVPSLLNEPKNLAEASTATESQCQSPKGSMLYKPTKANMIYDEESN